MTSIEAKLRKSKSWKQFKTQIVTTLKDSNWDKTLKIQTKMVKKKIEYITLVRTDFKCLSQSEIGQQLYLKPSHWANFS